MFSKILKSIVTITGGLLSGPQQEPCSTLLMPNMPVYTERASIYVKLAENTKDLDAYAEARYGEKGKEVLEKLASISPNFKVLIVDPGLFIRVDGFVNFAKNIQNLESMGPWQARYLYSNSLGTKTVYRSLRLTEAQANFIKSMGMEASLLRSQKRRKVHLIEQWPTLQEEIEFHQHGQLEWNTNSKNEVLWDPFYSKISVLSVSDHEKIASTVASTYEDERSVYVFTIKIPELDLIYQGDDSPFRWPTAKTINRNGKPSGMTTDWAHYADNKKPYEFELAGGERFSLPVDRHMESMVSFFITRQEIIDVKKLKKSRGFLLK